jgi:uncharacterized membrane protein YgdD (TMEM256/DUF423 family)
MPGFLRTPTVWLLTGALLGGLAVAMGAFGAHALKRRLSPGGETTKAAEQQLANWETAARYQMYHALALLAVGVIALRANSRCLDTAGFCMTAGTLIFSGCLYALVLSGQRWLGAVVPIGGSLLIAGWIALVVDIVRISRP